MERDTRDDPRAVLDEAQGGLVGQPLCRASNVKTVKDKMRSRWSRHMQRMVGTIQMWQVLSITGKFDPQFFASLKDPPLQEGELTADQKGNTKRAVYARARFRQARSYDRLRDPILAEHHGPPEYWLSKRQVSLLKLYDNGTLLKEANEATLLSGNGCLRPGDGARLNIGGSTGGYTRLVLQDWEPKDGRVCLDADPLEH